MVAITVQRVSKKRIKELWVSRGGNPVVDPPLGLTIFPVKTMHKPMSGLGRIEIYVQERISQKLARETILHELLHAGQFLCGCQVEETLPTEYAEVLLEGLQERKKK
jgi:hypothetical protein